MATPLELARTLVLGQQPMSPTPMSFAPTRASFGQPQFMPPDQQQMPPPAQPTLGQAVPLPQPNPMRSAGMAPPGQPLSIAPPGLSAPGNYSGAQGPQWNDQQWQNYWDRSQGQS